MKDQQPSVVFDQQRAACYDKQVAKLAPMRDALNFVIRMVLLELPADARILCIGVGTGSELIDLAQAFPQWQFTVVEPAAAMLAICRQRAEECGIASRCTFHEGYLDSLPEADAFDAVTSILVSQFFMQPEQRCNFFREIAARLCPDGYLVSADLASDISAPTYQSLFETWGRTMTYSEMPAEEVEKRLASLGKKVALLPPQDIASIIASSGFDSPVLFFQTLLIHAWYAKLAP